MKSTKGLMKYEGGRGGRRSRRRLNDGPDWLRYKLVSQYGLESEMVILHLKQLKP